MACAQKRAKFGLDIKSNGLQVSLVVDHNESWRIDGQKQTIIPNRSTAILGFVAGKFDLAFPFGLTVPLMKDIQKQAPQAHCELQPANRFLAALAEHEIAERDRRRLERHLAEARLAPGKDGAPLIAGLCGDMGNKPWSDHGVGSAALSSFVYGQFAGGLPAASLGYPSYHRD
jgi:hypothetical protein